MIKSLRRCAVALPALLLMGSCVDDSYDLSDVDTSSRFNVNDLVLPVNIDPIALGDVIDVDDESKIRIVSMDGQEFYALVQDGTFMSEAVEIGEVVAEPSPVNPTRETLERLVSGEIPDLGLAGDYVFSIREVGNWFSYNSLNIDDAIVSLRHVRTAPFLFNLDLEVEDVNQTIRRMAFADLVIRAPKGLVAEPNTGSYDPATGYWRIARVDVDGNHAGISLRATGIDTQIAGISILPDRSLDFNSEFHIESGYVHIEPKSPSFRDEVEFVVSYDFDDFEVKSFDGEVRYALDGIDIEPVSLQDIPDFLKGGDTEIEIANPQIYLQVNNPLAAVPLDCVTGLRLTALRDNAPSLHFDLDKPVRIGHALGQSGPYNFVLSPSDRNLNVPDGFGSGLVWNRFSSLGSLLATPSDWSVKGLPDKIEIDLSDAGIPLQSVTGFSIPCEFSAVEGRYELMAPLAMNDGSHIIYTDVRDGWNDDDIDALTITRLEVTAHAVNNCPASIALTVYPIDKNGETIDAKVESNTVAAGSETDLVIAMTGEVRHLDGIRLIAVLEADDSESPLSPSQTLVLDDIRVRVTGYYEKEF